MVSNKGLISALAGTFFLLAFLASCDDELDTLGEGVIAEGPFTTDQAEYDVFAYNKSVVAVQTNRLPLYQVGVYDDPIFGRREAKITTQVTFQNLQANPIFGNFTQEDEEVADLDDDDNTIAENETVKEVYLYLPYQLVPSTSNDRDGDGIPDELESPEDLDNADSDQDGDGLTDLEERSNGTNPFDSDTDDDGIPDDEDEETALNTFANVFALDSIFSRRFTDHEDQDQYIGEQFNIKVERSSFFLRDLDPNTNFEQSQEYFSNTDITTFVEGGPLFEGEVTLDNEEIVFFQEDDPETEDDDESLIIETRLNPGVRIPLDNQFFQENILDMEGSFELLSQSNFINFIRGLHISVQPVNEDLMILFDLTQANITITYEFDDFVTGDDEDGTEDAIEQVEREFTLNLLQVLNNTIVGNAVNTFVEDALPSNISSTLDTGDNTDRIYLKGGSGTYTEIMLFDEEDGAETINQIKANNWIINEANLVFHIDRNTLDNIGGTIEPPRLYLFNAENGGPIFNASNERSDNTSPLGQFLNYDGILERDSNGKGVQYKVRITDHINNIVLRDSTNVPLRLVLTSNIGITTVQEAEGSMSQRVDYPIMNVINPLGTVLYGSNVPVENEDKKLKLEIFYTESN